MKLEDIRKKIATQIVIFNMALIVSLIIYYILQGFDSKEFFATFTLITSVSSVYFGIIFQRISLAIKEALMDGNMTRSKVNEGRGLPKVLIWLIPLHFIVLFITISMKAFTIITFQEMNVFLATIEGIFGIYIGNILSNLFELHQEK